MSRRNVLLAACVLSLGLTGKAQADIPPPLPPAKTSVAVTIEVDEHAKGPRLVIPSQVFTQRFRPNGPKSELPQENGDGIADNDDSGRPQYHLLIAGVALTLAIAFGGLWLLRKNGKGSISSLALLIAGGAILTAGAIVWANAPVPPPIKERPQPAKQVAYPSAWEGKSAIEFQYGAEPVRLILDKDSFEKLKKGDLKLPGAKPSPRE